MSTQVTGSQPGKSLSEKQKNKMLQLYAVEGNKREVARLMNLAESTVHRHLKEMLSGGDPDVVRARKQTLVRLAAKTTKKANMILDSITEQDLDSGLIKTFHPVTGDLERVRAWGPSLLQKVTAGAIMTDKIKAIRDCENLMSEGTQEGEALMPASFSGLLSGVKNRLKEMTFLNLKFEDEHPDLSQRAQQIIEEAEIVQEIQSNVVVENLDDFDGND